MKKITFIIAISALLILVGCSKTPANPGTNNDLTANEKDQARIDQLHQVTYSLGQFMSGQDHYPPAQANWCADDIVRFLENVQKLPALKEPKGLTIEELGECESGIYYFFREDNPDYYTFAMKLENDYLGNSYLSPKKVAELSLEELKPIRLGGNELSETARGNHYYIIGN